MHRVGRRYDPGTRRTGLRRAAFDLRLVHARLTGYGQSGPLAERAGHDINHPALSGAFEPLGPSDGSPLPAVEPCCTAGDLPAQRDRAAWPAVKARPASVFTTRTRDEWASVFDGTDACVIPVLSPFKAHLHPHHFARGTFTEVGGQLQPSPASRLSRTPAAIASSSPRPGEHTDTALADWG